MQQLPITPTDTQVQKMDTTTGINKGYSVNQGGRNAWGGFRGRHSYLQNRVKIVEPEVKPVNTLEDSKPQADATE